MIKSKRLFLASLIFACTLRIFLLFWSVTYPLDINGDQFRLVDWAQSAHINGFSKTYEDKYVHKIKDVITVANNQPPGTIYFISGAYEIYILIGKAVNKITNTQAGSIHFVNTYLLHIMMRFPSAVADILIGVLLYLLTRKEVGEKKSVLAASIVWFNPIVLYNSTIWGQFDSVTSFLFILALFFAFRKNYIISILSFVSSVYIKLSILPLFPFFLVFLYYHSKKQLKKLILGIILSIIAVLIATFPISPNPIAWLITKLPTFAFGEAQNITSAAFNFWFSVTCFPNFCPNTLQSHSLLFGIPLGYLAYGLFSLFALPILYLQIKKSQIFITKKFTFFAFSLIALSVFMFMPRMHDRYMYPFFIIFPAALVLMKNSKKYFILFGILALLHFANLIASWYPTRYPSILIAEILNGNTFRWIISVLTVITFLLFYKKSFKELLSKTPESL